MYAWTCFITSILFFNGKCKSPWWKSFFHLLCEENCNTSLAKITKQNRTTISFISYYLSSYLTLDILTILDPRIVFFGSNFFGSSVFNLIHTYFQKKSTAIYKACSTTRILCQNCHDLNKKKLYNGDVKSLDLLPKLRFRLVDIFISVHTTKAQSTKEKK